MGYKWKAGDGSRIRLWEDLWFGTCSLAIQYWRLYCIVNEQGVTIKKAWDGVNLKFTFRRMVNRELMDQWLELVQITGSIHLSNDEDAIIWQYESKGRYSVQSLYAVVNNRGGGYNRCSHLQCEKSRCPPRLHIFLWLLANGKVLTRDNLAKRRHVEDKTCLFCKEAETPVHVFYDCCVAKVLWERVSEVTDLL
jgi:hypothetical protein